MYNVQEQENKTTNLHFRSENVSPVTQKIWEENGTNNVILANFRAN